MRQTLLSIRDRMDRFGVLLSGLCAVHCVLGIVLVGMLGVGGPLLLAPEVHQIGLALAVAVGFISLGFGAVRHGRMVPLLIGGVGLSLMTAALFVGHGLPEAVLTICGVSLVAAAHILNLRSPHLPSSHLQGPA
jgi:NO-binding membrane sensor protein with MHYT domain